MYIYFYKRNMKTELNLIILDVCRCVCAYADEWEMLISF